MLTKLRCLSLDSFSAKILAWLYLCSHRVEMSIKVTSSNSGLEQAFLKEIVPSFGFLYNISWPLRKAG